MKKIDWSRLFGKKNADVGGEKIEFQPESNFYYAGVSTRFSFAAIILVTLLILFIAGSLIFKAKLFTYQNFFYLFKDIDAANDNGAQIEMISYTSSSSQSYAEYKKGVCILGENQISVYTSGGKKTLEASVFYSTPVLKSSEKYILAYDLGGNRLSLYNSFANIYSIEYENAITGADISDKGYFAAVTSTQEYNSLIEVYNSDFELINQVGRNGYVTQVSLSPDSDRVAFSAVNASGGQFVTEFAVFKIGTERISDTAYFYGVVPYGCEFITSSRIALICEGITYILDNGGNVINRYFYSGEKLSSYACSDGHIVLIFENDPVKSEYEIVILDKDGKTLSEKSVLTPIDGAVIYGNYLFTYGGYRVTRYSLSGGSGNTVDTDVKADMAFPISDKSILVCSSVGAKYVTFY